jgi:hypothetical protein
MNDFSGRKRCKSSIIPKVDTNGGGERELKPEVSLQSWSFCR